MTNQNSVGAGQQTPLDSIADMAVVVFAIRQIIAELDTMKPCQVVAVHGGGGAVAVAGTVDVQLLVSQIDGAANAVPQGVVYGLPYFRLQAGQWAVIADPVVNDFGFAVCADRDISSLKNAVANGQSGQGPPPTRRTYNVSDGIFVGGCLNAAPTAYIQLNPDGTFKLLDGKGNSIAGTAAGMTLSDLNGNQIQMKVGNVNVVTTSFSVNGTPITIP